jgi:hypothetical protein
MNGDWAPLVSEGVGQSSTAGKNSTRHFVLDTLEVEADELELASRLGTGYGEIVDAGLNVVCGADRCADDA